MIRAVPFVFAAALLTASPALAGNRTPDVVEDAAVYALSDRARAAELLEQAVQDASRRDRPAVQLYAGEYRRLMGERAAARAWFQKVLEDGSRHANADAAQAGLALIDASEAATPDNLARLRTLKTGELLDSQNADRFLALAIIAAAEGDARGFEDSRSRAISFAADDPGHSERIVSRLSGVEVRDPSTGAPPAYTLDAVEVTDLELADQALAQGDAERVRSLVERIRANNPTESEALAADYLLRRLDAAPVSTRTIGVLLPTSGRYGTVSSQVQQALGFGFREGRGRGELVVVDSGTTAESAVAALERLVLERGAVAIAGPLLSDQAEAVAKAAEALRVPLIGLSQALEPAEEQEWVYRGVVSVSDQVDALLNYTTDQAGMDAYAIFAPDNDYGRGAAAAFTAAAEARGARITAAEFYDPESNDMTEAARALARADYSARRAELARLRREAEANGGNPSSVSLPPTLDFDGLFIPDNARRVPLACAALAYEEFPVGAFQPRDDQPTIPLLGLNTWNREDLLTQGGAYVRNALFTELFVADDDNSQRFESAYRTETGRTPSALEAVVYDIGRITAAASLDDVRDRATFRDALEAAAPDDVVTGTSGFDPDTNTARHRLRILTISRDSIDVVE